ncbi:hypothetical protein TVAG_181630 [Trichomonas vaginalis G3]|uniref:Chromo domain-containing protein n=1 Tax=Trichomonas vaginalis (strain ATCC PRA-98 / G3) TaxID=412133 RepID=A2GB75_TRIV3|nr:methylated histone binding [Trichomonas vaginalis G3]EAX85594.1 hypothetical protein TVAG_181630 [Trichomonas vaginalis G3]KAI5486598.1 methylated histone binding [Trichomonas vaginalis G3]|eukprot:XP_001298524.1 hypothetical protein [Trichomonas vaginalis G3]
MSSDSDASGGEVYEVQEIIDERKSGSKTLYLVLWKGYSREEATWEPISNLGNAKEAIKKFRKNRFSIQTAPPEKQRRIESVVGAKKHNGDIVYSVVYRGSDEISEIPRREAISKYPQQIIDYYEDHIHEIAQEKE